MNEKQVMIEANEIDFEDIEAAASMFDRVIDGKCQSCGNDEKNCKCNYIIH